jgi:hypothetical protein
MRLHLRLPALCVFNNCALTSTEMGYIDLPPILGLGKSFTEEPVHLLRFSVPCQPARSRISWPDTMRYRPYFLIGQLELLQSLNRLCQL